MCFLKVENQRSSGDGGRPFQADQNDVVPSVYEEAAAGGGELMSQQLAPILMSQQQAVEQRHVVSGSSGGGVASSFGQVYSAANDNSPPLSAFSSNNSSNTSSSSGSWLVKKEADKKNSLELCLWIRVIGLIEVAMLISEQRSRNLLPVQPQQQLVMKTTQNL